MIPTGNDFQQALDDLFDDALRSGQPFVVVKAIEFHDRVVGADDIDRHSLCAGVMKRNCHAQDEILTDSHDGLLVVCYRLPRGHH